MPNRYPPIHYPLRDTLDWHELSLDFQLAALDVWFEFGRDAVRVFSQGA